MSTNAQADGSKLIPHHGVAAGLHWVRAELDQNLQLASQLVEQHSEQPQDPGALNKALAHLHEVRGAAVLIQAYGVALLAEEMKQTVQDLIDARVHEPDPAYSAIVSACLQASDYLDLLQQGQDDSALVLQPIVNELRLARGKSLLTEDDLFVAQFRVLGLHLERGPAPRSEVDVQAEAARLSPVFSAALLSWFKDQDSTQALSRIGRVAEILGDAARDRNLFQLWRTAAACVEALMSSTLEESLELKRQFGRAGQLMKILAESGERMAAKQMSDVSLRLLFHAGRSTGTGPRITALRAGLRLDTWLPSVDAIHASRARLRGANTGLLVRVAEELRADLAEVRDSIDVALRSGASEQEFESTAQRLKRVADTLLVLGLSAESQALAQPVETLRDTGAANPAAWMEFATAVLQVDLSLEGALYRQLQAVPQADGSSNRGPATADLREGTGALLRESLVNIARIKTYVESYIKSDDVFGLPEAARLLDEIAAGFRMLALERAENLVLEVQQFLTSPRFALVRSDNTTAGRFADAVAAIEYYLEFRRDGSPGAESALDQLAVLSARLSDPLPEAARKPEAELPAEMSLEEMAQQAVAVPVVAEPAPAPAAAPSFELALVDYVALAAAAPVEAPPAPVEEPEYHLLGEPTQDVELEPEAEAEAEAEPAPVVAAPAAELTLEEEFAAAVQAVAEFTAAAPAAPPQEEAFGVLDFAPPAPVQPVAVAVVPAPPAAGPAKHEVDPEIRQIFIDEAEEVLQTLQHALPRWLRQSDDRETLGIIRRSFHTLKGSGRMVGAQDIGEFGWATENLLNRCLDRTITLSAAAQDTVRDAVGLVPAMIAAFRDGMAQPTAVPSLLEQARRLAAGEDARDEDADIIAVFRSDALARLSMITRWLVDQDRQVGEYGIPEPVVRAFHTLRGAALAIGARAVGELSGSLENYLDTLHRAHMPLSGEGLKLLDDSCAVLNQWIVHLGEPAAAQVDPRPWLERVEAIRAGAHEESGHTDEDLQLAEVFAFEALDLVQKLESDLLAWARSPSAPGYAKSLKTTVHTLKGAAGMAHCAPIAAVAQALNLRLGMMADTPAPKPAFFDAMKSVVEGLFTQLDAYRDGKLAGDGSEWLSGVLALDDVAPVASTGPADAPPIRFAPELSVADAELLQIFLHEGEELLEKIEQQAFAISARPSDPHILGAWQRELHTLKGSARVAGRDRIGDLAHRLESATEAVHREGSAGHELFRTRVRVAIEGLHELLDEVRSGGSGVGERVLARFDALGAVVPVVPAPQEVATPPEPLAAAEDLAPPAEADALPFEEAEPAVVDPEMLAIFAPEAQELLEALQTELNTWRENPGNPAPSREMQRDLHTFKGGARMTGLSALGNAAHALETELVQIERDGNAVEAGVLQRIAARLDALHQLYDQASTILPAPAPILAPAPAAPEPPMAELPEPQAPIEIVQPPVADLVFQSAPEPSSALASWEPQLFWRPGGDEAAVSEARREAVRVPVEKLDTMLNQAGEISIYRSRLEENHASLASSLAEMAQTITRVREQLRLMEVETEAQIAARGFSRRGDAPESDGDDGEHRYESQFDPLEMDRYSRMQELSRALAESVSDLGSLHASLDTSGTEAEGLLQQQGRINNEVQQGLMSTLMVPFSRQVQRLARVVRQTAEQNGKQARAEFSGAESELDRNVLERMTAPLEHLLRNSVVHGIEDVDTRLAAGKPAEGLVHVALKREGSQLLIEVRDDGRGLDYLGIRAQAVKRGLMRADAQVSDDDLARFVFAPGFSTARTLTQDAGRGIGMDVVAAEVKQLGGAVDIASDVGRGARTRIRLPLMLAVSQALVVQVGEELFAIPLGTVEGIARAPREALAEMMREGGRPLEYGGQQYQVRRLGELVGLAAPARVDARTVPAILMRLGDGLGGPERRVAVVAERLIGNREIVSKPAGPVLGSVAGISGATILADGRAMLIVDVPALIREATRRRLGDEAAAAPIAAEDVRRLIMVVDDSITIRRVTERFLTRKGYRVITAKDGLDAMATLQTETPDALLLDIEMPRADGFEVAAYIRNTPRIASLPIIMITSRSGDKHREHARQIGVNRYLIKPYQEDEVLAELRTLLAAREALSSAGASA